jgi:transcriptional regulator with XRE-family HTH domain
MPDDIAVGRQVQAVRLVRNLRQIDVAARAGVSAATIHAWSTASSRA